MVPLSPRTRHHLETLFPSASRSEAARLLESECADELPFCEDADADSLERIRFAVLKLSQGDLATLKEWVNHAKMDWRDVLVAAGWGNDTKAHLRWHPHGERH